MSIINLNSMKAKIKRLSLTSACLGMLFIMPMANAVETTIPVDMSGVNTTRHEIAVLHVLSDICPSMLSSQQRQNFYRAYNAQLGELLPTVADPKAAMQYLSTQQDYRQVLGSIRNWTMGFSFQENKALCEELAGEKP